MTEKKAKNIYKKFFGRKSKKVFNITLGDMSNLTLLGVIHKIEYIAKKNQFGDKENIIYVHEFKQPVKILWNGKDIILHGNIKVTERGII